MQTRRVTRESAPIALHRVGRHDNFEPALTTRATPMRISTVLLITLSCIANAVRAQDPAALGSVIDDIMHEYARDDSPGVVVAVVQHGEVTLARAYGMANLEHGLPMTRTTPNDLGSVSKQFTAFAIALLAQRGKLGLDDDIRTHLPEIPDLGATIRIRHLIHHMSGIREIYGSLQIAGWQGGDRIAQEDALRLMVRQRELNFEPGTEYLYCNTAYMLLAEIVSRVGGRPFPEWMQQNVFDPLGMSNTTIMSRFGQVIPKVADSYRRTDDHYLKVYDNSTIMGAGGIYSTVDDLAKWIGNFAHPVVGDAATIEQMQQRGVLSNGDTLNYAFGITVGQFRGLRRLQHSGSSAGYRASLAYFPAVDVGIVTLSNFAGFDRRLQNELAEAVLGDRLAAASEDSTRNSRNEDAKPAQPFIMSPEELADYAGMYYSPELETVYRFTVVDGALMADHRRYDPFEVSLITRDEFDGPSFVDTIRFERDEFGRVTGMRVSNGRVRNLWFEKRN
jgi:CubicO group peptidase (beta-lactamase class C family)